MWCWRTSQDFFSSPFLTSISLTETMLRDMRQMSLSRDCLGSTFWYTDQSRRKNVLCIFTNRILIEAVTFAETSLCKKMCSVPVWFFLFVCMSEEIHINSSFRFFLHHYSVWPKINIVIAGPFTGGLSPSFEAECWTEELPYCLPFSASHQSAHLPRYLRLSRAKCLPIYSSAEEQRRIKFTNRS